MIPKTLPEALAILRPILDASPSQLAALSKESFLEAWNACAFTFPGLHPDEMNPGDTITEEDLGKAEDISKCGGDARLVLPYFIFSGWPVALVPLVGEAWRRQNAGELTDEEMYPLAAQKAGMEVAC